MREVSLENVWTYFGRCWIVIPTNCGWTKTAKDDPALPCGPNPMGAGLAKEAAARDPLLPQVYGLFCYYNRDERLVSYRPQTALIWFPTKPLNTRNPHLSWKSKANLEWIDRAACELAALDLPLKDDLPRMFGGAAKLKHDDVLVPAVGTGSGGLSEDQVLPILHDRLTSDRFVYVRWRPF